MGIETKALNTASQSSLISGDLVLKTLEAQILGHSATLIFIDGFVPYKSVTEIDLDFPINEIVVFSGKMPSWYQLALVSKILKENEHVKAVGIFRPPADKVFIVYSELDDIPTGYWHSPSKKQLEFLRSGNILL